MSKETKDEQWAEKELKDFQEVLHDDTVSIQISGSKEWVDKILKKLS